MSVFRIDYTIDNNYNTKVEKNYILWEAEKISDIDYTLVRHITKGHSHEIYNFVHVIELNDVELLLEKLNNKFIHRSS